VEILLLLEMVLPFVGMAIGNKRLQRIAGLAAKKK
jgi:hypothetical protein